MLPGSRPSEIDAAAVQRYVKIEDVSRGDADATPGYDLDAVTVAAPPAP